jgi:hypothetical protein
MGKSVLTLDTIEPDRDFIVINEKPYYLRGDEELSLKEIARIRRTSKKVLEKGLDIDSTEEEMAEIEGFANQILAIILIDLPPEIRDKLSTMQKFQVVQAFTSAASSKRAGTKAEQGSPTTEGSLQGSEGSTEAPSTST